MTREQFIAQQVALWSGRYTMRQGRLPTVPQIESARKEYDDEYSESEWAKANLPELITETTAEGDSIWTHGGMTFHFIKS
jgi:hypothetical protein